MEPPTKGSKMTFKLETEAGSGHRWITTEDGTWQAAFIAELAEERCKEIVDLLNIGEGAKKHIIDLCALLDHFAKQRPTNWDGSTHKQAFVAIRDAKKFLSPE